MGHSAVPPVRLLARQVTVGPRGRPVMLPALQAGAPDAATEGPLIWPETWLETRSSTSIG